MDSPGQSHRTDSPQQPTRKLRLTSMFGKSFRDDKSRSHRCKESDIKKIIEMGFTRDQAITALLQNDHNIVMAIHSLTG